MSKPKIGITLCIDRGHRWRPGFDYLYVHRAYARRVNEAGGVPILLGVDTDPTDALELCDGVVLTGGDDLPTTRDELDAWCAGGSAGGEATADGEVAALGDTAQASASGAAGGSAGGGALGAVGRANTLGAAEDVGRIVWERALIDAAERAGKPLLGICYGMQLLNLHYGGSLLRDVRNEHAGALDHGGSGRVTEHRAAAVGQSVLLGALRFDEGRPSGELTINSCHGQAVQGVAPGFLVTARAEDGVIEAIERGSMYGLEWHPEMDATGPALYARFVELCRAG